MTRFRLGLMMAGGLLPALALAGIVTVPGEAPTIQAGIDLAAAGDTVLVSCGVYHEHDLAMKSGVVLLSEIGDPDCAVIDAEQLGQVLSCIDVDDQAAVIGFTLKNGVDYMVHYPRAGGVDCRNAYLSFIRCRIRDNEAGVTGGMGGGVYCLEANPRFFHCEITDNRTVVDTGWGYGGGVYCGGTSQPQFDHCTFARNVSNAGTAVYAGHNSAPRFDSCLFFENRNPTQPDDWAWWMSCSPMTVLACCDAFGNAGGDDFCGIDGGGNFSADPWVCAPDEGDYRLSANSPCLPLNNDCGELIGALGEGCPGTAVARASWSRVKESFR